MKKIYSYLPLLLIFLFQNLHAQISFTNKNDLLVNSDVHSGVAIAVTDMNGDGKDDIVRMDEGYSLSIEYQNGTDELFTPFFIGDVDNGSQWSMCVADVDNNGFNEVLAGDAYGGVKLSMANEDGSQYSIGMLPGPTLFVQGSNFVDINNDGFLDAFACHDDGESRIWGNDGAGNLVEHDEWIDMSLGGDSGEPASGNYGSVWTDFDNDGDIDLYIAKCRQGASSTTDPRRINQLYVNDGLGNYTEQGEAYGLRIGWQSWTADFQDVNNDGWLDCFITNHDYQSQLMINDGTGQFTEATNTGINVQGLPIQGVMRDFDNDGFVDILVSGTEHHLFKNNGDLTFTEVDGLFDNNDIESYALGDLNDDGFVDIYAGYAGIYTNPSNIDDVIWMNDGNENNYLAVDLQGVISNRSAVGARVEIYGDWGIQIREVRAGESYGIMNSMIQYFGLGTATEIDSVTVRWPSGTVQTEYDISINSRLQLLEGACLAAAPELMLDGETEFCTGDQLTISAPLGYETYKWSTGETTSSIQVGVAGNYGVTVTDAEGCFGFSSKISTSVDPVLSPEIITEGPLVFCEGESVVLREVAAPTAITYTWSNGDIGDSITVVEGGEYFVLAEGLCNEFISNSILVDVLDSPDAPLAVGDTLFTEGIAELSAEGDSLLWYDVETGGTPIGNGNSFTTPIISATQTYYVEDRNIIAGGIASGGMLDHSGTLYSSDNDDSNQLIFDAFQPFTLDSVKTYTDQEGIRKIILLDDAGNLVNSTNIMVPLGENMVYVGMEIPEGENLIMTTDPTTNLESLGFMGPRLQRSSEDVAYPYLIGDLASLNSSNYGGGWYYYFYDWKVSTPSFTCVGERSAVEALLDPSLAAIDFSKTDDVKVFPNPTDGRIVLELKFDISEKVQLRVLDLTGRLVFENTITAIISEMYLDDLAKGVYTMQVIHGEDVYFGKIVMQ